MPSSSSAVVAVVAEDRRNDVRLAGCGEVDAVVVDRFSQPVRELEGARVVNVSAGGMALRTHAPLAAGSHVVVTLGDARPTRPGDRRVKLEAIGQHVTPLDGCVIHCRLIEGCMPARLIHRW
jgi:hypothetical protein